MEALSIIAFVCGLTLAVGLSFVAIIWVALKVLDA